MTQQEIIDMIEAEWRDRLKAAVLDERKACSQVANKYHMPMCDTIADVIAEEILARGEE
jgi:hypothetical protein